MIRDAGGHSRCPGQTPPAGLGGGKAQTRMRRTEVVDCTNQIHPVLQRQRVACERSASTGQRREVLPECRVEPFDVRRIDHPGPVRAAPQRLDACRRAIHDAALDVDRPPLGVALHDLRNAEVAPGAQPRAPLLSRTHGITEGLVNRSDVGAQAIGTEQQGTVQGTAAHTLNETPNQRHVAVLTHLPRQPQACADHHGQSHPDNAALFLDADLVGLHLPQITWLLDEMLLHSLAVPAASRHPTRHRPLIIAKRNNNRLQWTTVGHQRHHKTDRLRRGPQAIEGRALRGGERLVALGAHEAVVLPRVDANVALACLSSGGAGQIGAECRCGVHDDSPLLALLESVPSKEYVWTPIFIASEPHHGLVGSYLGML